MRAEGPHVGLGLDQEVIGPQLGRLAGEQPELDPVDLVGVPLLFSAGYYASGLMYVFYGVFTLTGFFVWMRQRVRPPAAPITVG